MSFRDREDELALLIGARDGDREAFAGLVRMHRSEAMQVALGLLGNEQDALDLTQEAFLRALGHMHRFDVDRPFFPWFYRILRNLCFNHLAKRRRHGECPLVLESDGGIDPRGAADDPLQTLAANERADFIWRALCALREDHREIIMLRHFQDCSYREIAEILGIPRGTVMSRLYYARGALARELDHLLAGDGASLAEAREVN